MQERDEISVTELPGAGTSAAAAAGAEVTADPAAGARAAAASSESAAPAAAPVAEQPQKRLGLLLAVCCVAQFMVILDLSIVNVALPTIQDALNFSSADLQWVIDAYSIAFAGFLMVGGRAADQLGHRRVFIAALILFSVTSLIGGLSGSREMLIVARGVQGFSCAFMAAASLAIITHSFPPGPQLHRAVGLWAAMNGLGGAAGVLFGGIITQEISWRWILLINPPIGIAAAVVGYYVVKDRKREGAGPSFDLAGAITLTVGQVILVYGVVEAGIYGISNGHSLIPIIIGLVLLAGFNVVETRIAKDPLIPFKEMTRALSVANLIVLLFSAALFPMWYLASLYLQQVLGISPLKTGLAIMPMALVIFVVARQAGKLVTRFGVRAVLGGGLTMMTVAMVLFSKIADGGSAVVYITVPGLLMAAGIGMSIVPSTIAATQGSKPGQSGLASGLVNTSRQIGGGLGIAVLITIATSRTSSQIGHGEQVSQALTNGFKLAFLIGAGCCAAAALLTFIAVPRPKQAEGSLLKRAPIALGVLATIGVLVAVDFGVGGSHAAPIGKYSLRNTYSFVSSPGLHPPKLKETVTPKSASTLGPGYIFMANFYNLSFPPIQGQSGPEIMDNNLQPVWFKPVNQNLVAGNLSLQTYHGKPALGYWQGNITNTGATNSGEYVLLNQHYQKIGSVQGKDGWVLTLHSLTVQGNLAWVTANKNIPYNLSKYGGAYNGALIDSAVQAYNIRTGKLVYNWDALKHIPLSESYASLPTNGFPWDAYHINAIDLGSDGTFVTSMRDTWAAYKVNIKSQQIEWTLGGRKSSFTFGHDADFSWQHDVTTYAGDSLITMFDDHCCQLNSGGTYVPPTKASRAITLKLNQQTHTATLADMYLHGNIAADYMGSMQPLSNGDEFVGWGSQPYISEYSVDGKLLFDAELPGENLSYRAMREPWVGVPLTNPAGAARSSGGHTTVYASWNGATQVVRWRVLGGSAGALRRIGTAARSGFETAIAVPAGSSRYELQALGAGGKVLGTSRPFTAKAAQAS